MPLILQVSDGVEITAPTDQQIQLAIMNLGAGEEAAFAILGRSDDPYSYIQAAGDHRSGFTLEYQIHNTENHFRAMSTCEAEQVIAAFVAYRDGNERWRAEFEWEHMLL